MKSRIRYLTKSRFKIGCECPTKLYYSGKSEYGNNKLDDAFLEALAEGGFQVGALAKLYHPGGVEITTLDNQLAVAETEELLKRDSIVLYEPAIRSGDLLVRVDILVKQGDCIELIEVKAKSFDSNEEDSFYTKISVKKGKPQINGKWEPYLLDIAFQTYVARLAFPKWKINSFLMLADKTTTASVDGLNQRFFLKRDEKGRVSVDVAAGTSRSDLGTPVLIKVGVDAEVKLLLDQPLEKHPFDEYVRFLTSHYVKDEIVPPALGGKCKTCEFRIDEKKIAQGQKSGFEACWKTAARFSPEDFSRPLVFDLWDFRKSPQLIEEGRYFVDDITEVDIDPKPKAGEAGLSRTERQWIQVEKIRKRELSPYVDVDGLTSEMRQWKFPLHFIDFETAMVAIPFHKGMRPYEQIAFQFSHHVVTADGRIEHRDEYIHKKHGEFPNFEFVRNLKRVLSTDEGTVFRYAAHENTVLCQIHEQLSRSLQPDKNDLMSWIRTLTTSTESSSEKWDGARGMVDLCDLVKRYYYHPFTQGSNSIKDVLPAVLASSLFLQERYSQPIYGSANSIPSHNFKDWQWIKKDGSGNIIDPYKLLLPVFDDIDLNGTESFITEGNIADGGAAMTAFARMQFTQMSGLERDRVRSALLKYCELDTLAMVMIYEYWKNIAGELS
jgi:hypothetical protein